MAKFKIGDIVRAVEKQVANGVTIGPGYLGTVTHIDNTDKAAIAVDGLLGSGCAIVMSSGAFDMVEEYQYKVGDKVRVVSCPNSSWWYSEHIGEVFTLSRKFSQGIYTSSRMFWAEENISGVLHTAHFELVIEDKEMKEKTEFDIKTMPWFIQYNDEQEFEIIQEWLLQNYGANFCGKLWPEHNILTNIYHNGRVAGHVMQGTVAEGASEIKFKFKLKAIVDFIEYPAVKTEQQKQIEELEETVQKALVQIAELKAK